MSIYDIEKKRLSDIQSHFHKVLNNLKKSDTLENINKNKLLEMVLDINSTSDILISKLISLNDFFMINNQSYNQNDNFNSIRIKELENDNKAINDLIPILFIYRMVLNP